MTQTKRKSLAITRRIAIEEDLRTRSVTCAPGNEVHSNADGLLGLTTDVPRQHGHAETLSGPKGEDDPVANEQTRFGGVVLVFDGHDDDSTAGDGLAHMALNG
jgi:hypothetical protein